MKHEIFSGYTYYRDREYIFHFDNYELELVPANRDYLIEDQSIFLHDKLTKNKKDGWINDIVLEGKTIDNKRVFFCIKDHSGTNNGIFNHKVRWFYISNSKKSDNIRIQGINFVSQEINAFYNLKKYIKDDFDIENGCFSNYQLEVKTLDPDFLGRFRFSNYGVTIFGGMSWRKNYSNNNNLEVWSKLSLELSRETDDLQKIYELILLQKLVIDFLTYRSNNSFDTIDTYVYDENKKRCNCGSFFINNNCVIEKDYDVVKHMITSDDLSNFGQLYKLILDNKLYFAHICKSQYDKKIYNLPRMLGIMIAFERVFSWQYGKEKIRSKDYQQLLKNIESYLRKGKDIVCNGITKKRNFNKILKNCTEIQVDYGSRISYVINDIPLCVNYIENIYNVSNIETIIDKICTRVNKLRNDMAHGNMDIDLSVEHTYDIKLIEIIIYIMILKSIGVTDDNIVNKINWLFNIVLFIK